MFSIDSAGIFYQKYPVRMKQYFAKIFAFIDYSLIRTHFGIVNKGFLCIPKIVYSSFFSNYS
jgi:hypothetical protein